MQRVAGREVSRAAVAAERVGEQQLADVPGGLPLLPQRLDLCDALVAAEPVFLHPLSDEAWVVVDVDRWEKSEFSKLLNWVEADSRHHLAISNPKFELFLLMYFDKGNGCTTAQAIDSALKRCMSQYEKRINADQFSAEDVKAAINNASMKRRNSNNIIPDPGMTDAYLLAERLIGEE